MENQIITYKELLEKSESSLITYSELLLTKEWQQKRNEIIERDSSCCSRCGKTETLTHVDDEHPWKVFFLWFGKDIQEDTPEIIPSSKPYWMEVHHIYYVLNKLPWLYENDALITLCNWCHRDLHLNETVKVYSSSDLDNLVELELCYRCNGAGWFPEYEHVQGGVCFRCRGSKYELPPIKTDQEV